jgi:hypothetical protein
MPVLPTTLCASPFIDAIINDRTASLAEHRGSKAFSPGKFSCQAKR